MWEGIVCLQTTFIKIFTDHWSVLYKRSSVSISGFGVRLSLSNLRVRLFLNLFGTRLYHMQASVYETFLCHLHVVILTSSISGEPRHQRGPAYLDLAEFSRAKGYHETWV